MIDALCVALELTFALGAIEMARIVLGPGPD